MMVNVASRKLVKPYKPTPSHLRSYKISYVDESNPVINHVRILYFSSNSGTFEEKSVRLEESLAQILSNYYPLAGRYNKEKRQVDCNDEGAHFSTSEADGNLSQIITAGVEPEQLNQFLPVDITATDGPNHPLLAVQINRFKCGGLAIGACGSHRVMDSAGFAQFLTAWAKAAASSGSILTQPYFDTHSFPSENLAPHGFHSEEKVVVRRLVFDSKAIEKLRQQLTEWKSVSPRQASRVLVVYVFLSQALLRADMSRRGKARGAVMVNHINIRERTVPPMPNNTFGNWVAGAVLELTAAEAEAHAAAQEFPALAAKIYNTTVQSIRDCARALSDKALGRKLLLDVFDEATEKAASAGLKDIRVTDISKFGEYDIDFGFGKPEWVSIAAFPQKDLTFLLNNRTNDGMEAWVGLLESDMHFFRQEIESNPMFTFS